MTRSGLIFEIGFNHFPESLARFTRLRRISAVAIAVTAVVVPLFLVGATGCGGCGSDRGVAVVPRPVAYPRIAMPDSDYVDLPLAGVVRLKVNGGTDVNVSSHDGAEWIDIRYQGVWGEPVAYLTLTEAKAEDVEAVMANRRDRISLNLGGLRYELTELTSVGGWECLMAVARGSLTTPVQVLARKGERVISGALVLTIPPGTDAPDPVAFAPVVDAVERDMLVLLKSL